MTAVSASISTPVRQHVRTEASTRTRSPSAETETSEWSQSTEGESSEWSQNTEAESFDEYDDNKWWVLGARLGFKLNEQVEAGVGYWRDEFTTNRFQRDGLTEYLPGSLLLNPNDGDYAADIFAADLVISFP